MKDGIEINMARGYGYLRSMEIYDKQFLMSLSGLAGLVKCNCFQNKKLYQNDILAQEQNGW